MKYNKPNAFKTRISVLSIAALFVSVLISAVGMTPAFAVTNIAIGKTASADSAQAANPAANGNDGSASTRWSAANGNTGHWWKVDLGASTNLSGSEVMWEFNGRVYKYKVEVSTDNSTWTLKVDKTNNTSTAQTQTDSFTATARYVRITVTGLQASPATWAGFYEFRVFDTSTGSGGQTITNDTVWKDTSGNTLYAQGGGILKVGSTYYWYGSEYQAAHDSSQSSAFLNVNCYSSTDLKNWKFEKHSIVAGANGVHLASGSWVGREDVIYNATTQKYVMLINYEEIVNGTAPNGVAFATSSSPTGTFTFAGIQTVITNVYFDRPGDQSVFTDDNGTPYLIFSDSHGRAHAYVAPIRTSDYLQINPATLIYTYPSGGLEANNVFKRNGLYYYVVSETAGWKGSQTSYQTASSILGSYSAVQVMSGTSASKSHNSQVDFVVKVQGSSGTTYMFAGDRWSDFGAGGVGYYEWEPLSFSGNTPTFNDLSSWNLNAAAGTWTN